MVLKMIGAQLHRVIRSPATARIFNSFSFYGGYTALVVYAAAGRPHKGLYILAALLLLHFLLSHQPLKDLLFFISVSLVLCLIDIAYLTGGVLSYASPNSWVSWLPPAWIVGMYLLFAAAVDYSLFWLRNYPVTSAVLGSIGGVSSYLAGSKAGAAQFLLPDGMSLVVIGAAWFFIMPALCWYSGWLDKKFT